jgi:hypothetical protein
MYYDPVPRPDGVPTGTIDTGRITLALDTALVREWFSVTIDTSTNNQGMFITANPSNTIQGFWSFANPSAALFPKLRVRYSRNGVTTTYEHSTGFSRYLATVPPGDLLQDPSRLYVQTGVAYRGTLTFDLSSLPAPVSVNRAVIELSLDSVASDRSIYSSDSLFAFAVTGTGALGASTLGLGIPLPEPTRRVYSFNGESIVRTWLQSAVEQTAVIAGFSENSTLTRFVFFGPAAADDLRPRLIVTYSRVQKSGREGGGQ